MCMAESRSQFTFREDYYRELMKIGKKLDRLDLYEAICAYALYGQEPVLGSLRGCAVGAFERCRPLLDLDRRQATEGRHCTEYKAWRKSVFERDHYTCQVCGARGVKINAHHRKEYAFFPDLRYDLNNGVTLCVPCHKTVHVRRRRHG